MILLGEYPLSILASALPYMNPGTGGLLIQLILGALFAIGLTVRIFWSRIKKLLHIRSAEAEDENAQEKDGPN
jgi:hypothetical protein